MKATNFYRTIEQIRETSTRELREALEAHNGLYNFLERNNECPRLTFYGEEQPCDMNVIAVKIEGDLIAVKTDAYGCKGYDYSTNDIYADQIYYIIEFMDEPK